MTKQDLINLGIMTEEEVIEYEELLIGLKFFTLVNEQIDIEIEPTVKNYIFDKAKGKWRVRITVDGKRKYCGQYNTEQEAINRVKELKLTVLK